MTKILVTSSSGVETGMWVGKAMANRVSIGFGIVSLSVTVLKIFNFEYLYWGNRDFGVFPKKIGEDVFRF